MPGLSDLGAFPLEHKFGFYLARLSEHPPVAPSGLTREVYLDLAEPIVRAAAGWQEEDGIIAEPYPMDSRAVTHPSGRPWGKDWGKESATATSRFAGAVGQLVRAGHCADLVPAGARALEAVAEGLAVYALLAANLFGVAYHLADESISESAAPAEHGGFVFELPGDFHKVFAACGGYHLEIDTRADLNYDATGLGRVHRLGTPSELGPSTPITSRPRYRVSIPPFSRPVAVGPAWRGPDGTWHALAECSQEIGRTTLEVLSETRREVRFQLTYQGALPGGVEVTEQYRVTGGGIEVEDVVRGEVGSVRVCFPLLETDGLRQSEILQGVGRFEVSYVGSRLEVTAGDEDVTGGIEDGRAPNRNGIYLIGRFERKGNRISYRIRLLPKDP